MSLSMLFDPATVAAMMTGWPDKPSVHQLPDDSHLRTILTDRTLYDYLDTGCVPPGDVNIIKCAAPRHPSSFTTAGRLDAAKVRYWREQGYTVQLRHLEHWYPPMRVVTGAIQQETACTGYASAFVTPPGEQGLEWHWDQNLGIVVQLAGTKTWELWEPIVEHPTGDFHTSVQRWDDDWVTRCRQNGPDLTVQLTAGQVLVLPRGWIHNPHSRDSATDSVHVTVVIQERTPLWIAEHLVGSAIHNPAFRHAIPPTELTTEALTTQIRHVRELLIAHVNTLDPATFTRALRAIAERHDTPAVG